MSCMYSTSTTIFQIKWPRKVKLDKWMRRNFFFVIDISNTRKRKEAF